MRRAAKIDSNHNEIVAYLREKGCHVLSIHQLKNCCDVVVTGHNFMFYAEIKDGTKAKSGRRLTDGEAKFAAEVIEVNENAWFLIESKQDVDLILQRHEL
jgi:hypothetical protein